MPHHHSCCSFFVCRVTEGRRAGGEILLLVYIYIYLYIFSSMPVCCSLAIGSAERAALPRWVREPCECVREMACRHAHPGMRSCIRREGERSGGGREGARTSERYGESIAPRISLSSRVATGEELDALAKHTHCYDGGGREGCYSYFFLLVPRLSDQSTK